MIGRVFVEITMSENDRKLLIILLVLAVLVFILLGLLGMLLRYVMQRQGKRMDYYMHDPVVYRIISDPKHFRKYGIAQNHRILFREALGPFIIGAVSLAFYITYALITINVTGMGWTQDFWGQFKDLFYVWDWGNDNCRTTVWGVSVLARWPDLLSAPHWVGEHWASYILVPLWITAAVYYAIVVQAYISRGIIIARRARTIYEKSLEGYNYYDTMPKTADGFPIDPGALAQAEIAHSNVSPSNTAAGSSLTKK
jgi:hypothetical protein